MADSSDNSKSFLGKQDSFYESSNKRDSLSVEKKNTIIEKVELIEIVLNHEWWIKIFALFFNK